MIARGEVWDADLGPVVRPVLVANCDWVITLSKERLTRRRGRLDPTAVRQVNAALVLALGLDT